MTFAEAVDALKALDEEGIVVEATVWGTENDSHPLASLGGVTPLGAVSAKRA